MPQHACSQSSQTRIPPLLGKVYGRRRVNHTYAVCARTGLLDVRGLVRWPASTTETKGPFDWGAPKLSLSIVSLSLLRGQVLMDLLRAVSSCEQITLVLLVRGR